MTQPEDLLTIETSDHGLSAVGEIDAHTAPSLAAAIDAAAPDVRLDMSKVEFVDSSGLRVLIDAHQRLQEAGGSLTLVAPSTAVKRLLEISGVDDYLSVQA
ncbi:MAG: STAS domain-containing protein [Ilumatobacter sp.]|nr:STAS domain-containing protein [Ilumatobacter sp.]